MSKASLTHGDDLSNDQRHAASLIYIVGRVNQGIRSEMRLRLAEWNLSVQEYTTLSVLEARPGLSNAQLARRALIEAPSMIEILSKLEARGLVTRELDGDNGKIRRAHLTTRGEQLLEAANPVVREIQDTMLATVPDHELEIVTRIMRGAMEHLSQHRRRKPRPIP
jgi:DNA-binding MarR family transcriptional regulator